MKTGFFIIIFASLFMISCDDGGDGNSENNNNIINNNNVNNNNTNNNQGYCGDGTMQDGEECDDGNKTSGDGCSADCVLEYHCGDGVRQFDETCDGTDFGGLNCQMSGYLGGSLTCTDSCQIDESTCLSESDDLIGWYHMDSTSGHEPNDATETNLCQIININENSVIRGMPGKIGESMYFDGSADKKGFMDCGAGYTGMNELTIEAWIQISIINYDLSMIISNVESYDSTGLAFYMGINSDFKLEAAVADWNNKVESTNMVTTGTWHHVAFVQDSSDLTVYVDGQLAGTVANPVSSVPVLNDAKLYIANNYLGNGMAEQEHYFTGYIDEIKIWNKAKNASEICESAGGYFDAGADKCYSLQQ